MAVTTKPESRKTSSIRRLLAHHVGVEVGDALRPGEACQVLQQARPDAVALHRVGDGERDFGPIGAAASR